MYFIFRIIFKLTGSKATINFFNIINFRLAGSAPELGVFPVCRGLRRITAFLESGFLLNCAEREYCIITTELIPQIHTFLWNIIPVTLIIVIACRDFLFSQGFTLSEALTGKLRSAARVEPRIMEAKQKSRAITPCF